MVLHFMVLSYQILLFVLFDLLAMNENALIKTQNNVLIIY